MVAPGDGCWGRKGGELTKKRRVDESANTTRIKKEVKRSGEAVRRVQVPRSMGRIGNCRPVEKSTHCEKGPMKRSQGVRVELIKEMNLRNDQPRLVKRGGKRSDVLLFLPVGCEWQKTQGGEKKETRPPQKRWQMLVLLG